MGSLARLAGHLAEQRPEIHFPALIALGGFGIAMVLTSDDGLRLRRHLGVAGLPRVARDRRRDPRRGAARRSASWRPATSRRRRRWRWAARSPRVLTARDALPDDLEARRLTEAMTDADELVRPLSGSDWWNVPPSGEVPGFRVSDGPSGVRGQRFAGGPPSVSFPCGAALGATWDVELVARVGRGAGRGGAGQGRPRAARAHREPAAHAARRPPLRVLLRGPGPHRRAGGGLRRGPAGRGGRRVREAPGGQRPGARPLRGVVRARRAHAARGVAAALRARAAPRRGLVDDGGLQPAARHPLLAARAAAHHDPPRRVGLGRRRDLRLVRRPRHRRAGPRRPRPRDARPAAALGRRPGRGRRRGRRARRGDRGQARAPGAPRPAAPAPTGRRPATRRPAARPTAIAVAREAAAASFVLLRNDGLLPLAPDAAAASRSSARTATAR